MVGLAVVGAFDGAGLIGLLVGDPCLIGEFVGFAVGARVPGVIGFAVGAVNDESMSGVCEHIMIKEVLL
jgi:hypothetical protein